MQPHLLLLAGLVIATTLRPAVAADSTWLLCKGTAEVGAAGDTSRIHLVASLLEQRGADGGSRDLAITLVHGAHVARGVVRGATLGKDKEVTGVRVPVRLTATTAPSRVVFTGTGELAVGHGSVTLAGTLDLAFGQQRKPTRVLATATLACETLADPAIGQ